MRIILLLLTLFLLSGCTIQFPKQFYSSMEQGWSAVEVRNDVSYDRAWNVLYDILTSDFDVEFASKEDGYVRTSWLYTWLGTYSETYKVRIACKFSDDRKTLRIKPEALAFDGYQWFYGVDTKLVTTFKTDLMGTIGRTTR